MDKTDVKTTNRTVVRLYCKQQPYAGLSLSGRIPVDISVLQENHTKEWLQRCMNGAQKTVKMHYRPNRPIVNCHCLTQPSGSAVRYQMCFK